MNDMVLKMFQYAKMESEEYSLVRREIEMSSFLRNIIADRYMELEAREIEVEIEFPSEKVWAAIDVNEFQRMINNLITNVINHNDTGIKMLISMSHVQNKGIRIVIGDSGNVISKEIKENIFEYNLYKITYPKTNGGRI